MFLIIYHETNELSLCVNHGHKLWIPAVRTKIT